MAIFDLAADNVADGDGAERASARGPGVDNKKVASDPRLISAGAAEFPAPIPKRE